MSQRLLSFIFNHCQSIEDALERHLPLSSQPKTLRLNEAIQYSIFSAGDGIATRCSAAIGNAPEVDLLADAAAMVLNGATCVALAVA
jgi:hypothetical protein